MEPPKENMFVRPAGLIGFLGILTLTVPLLSLFLFVIGAAMEHIAFIWARRKRCGGEVSAAAIGTACLLMIFPAYLVTEAFFTAAPIAWAPVSQPSEFPEPTEPQVLSWFGVTAETFVELFYSLGPGVVVGGLIGLWFLDFAIMDMVGRILRKHSDVWSRRIHQRLCESGHLIKYESDLTGKEILYAFPFPAIPHVGTFRWLLFFGSLLFGPLSKRVMLIFHLKNLIDLPFLDRSLRRGHVDEALELFHDRSVRRKTAQRQAKQEDTTLTKPDDRATSIVLLAAGCLLLNGTVVGSLVVAVDTSKLGTTWPYLMACDFIREALVDPEKWEFEPLASERTVVEHNPDGSFTVRGLMHMDNRPKLEYSATVVRVEGTRWKCLRIFVPAFEFLYESK